MKKLLICGLTLTALSSGANAVCPSNNDQTELMNQLSMHKDQIFKKELFSIEIQDASPKATKYNVTVNQTSGTKKDLSNLQDPSVNILSIDPRNCQLTVTNPNVNKVVFIVTLNAVK